MRLSSKNAPARTATASTGAERGLFIRLALLVLILQAGPISIRDEASTSASADQILLRIVPLTVLALPVIGAMLAGKSSPRLFQRPAIYWWGFCASAGLGGLALGRYPALFTGWKSVELFLAVLIIAAAANRCTLEEVERTVVKVLEIFLIAVCVGLVFQPSSLRSIGVLVQLDSQIPRITPNKLAILAGMYLILLTGRESDRSTWRVTMGALLVFLAMSRSVLAILVIGAPFFLAPATSRNRLNRIGIAIATGSIVVMSTQTIARVLTKDGKVSDENILTISGRTQKWETAAGAIGEWPLGWGINGAYRDLIVPDFGRFGESNLGNVHSSLVESFLAAGLIGGSLWLLFWLYPYRVANEELKANPVYKRVATVLIFVGITTVVDSGYVLFTTNLFLATALVFGVSNAVAATPTVTRNRQHRRSTRERANYLGARSNRRTR